MIAAAADAVARRSDANTVGAALLPPMDDLRSVSAGGRYRRRHHGRGRGPRPSRPARLDPTAAHSADRQLGVAGQGSLPRHGRRGVPSSAGRAQHGPRTSHRPGEGDLRSLSGDRPLPGSRAAGSGALRDLGREIRGRTGQHAGPGITAVSQTGATAREHAVIDPLSVAGGSGGVPERPVGRSPDGSAALPRCTPSTTSRARLIGAAAGELLQALSGLGVFVGAEITGPRQNR
jgi:hypothetical protein